MNTILVVNSSARQKRSITRWLVDELLSEVDQQLPSPINVIHRDVGHHPPSLINESWIDAAFTHEDKRTIAQQQSLVESDSYLQELKRADIIVIAAPMYNYGMPASLKAWFDQVIRVNKTFTFDLQRGDYPLEPILNDKKLICLTSKGEFGFDSSSGRASMNHLDGHLITLSKYLGAEEVQSVSVEYQEFGDRRHESSKQAAHREVRRIAAELAVSLTVAEPSIA